MTAPGLEFVKAAGWLKELNFIDGKWMGADSGQTRPVDDPATRKTIGTIPWSGAAETRRAIDSGHAAFAAWSMTTAVERSILLLKVAAIIRDKVEVLASLLTLEQGKPLAEARKEMLLGANYVQCFAEEARRMNGEAAPSPWRGRQILVTREPVGVVATISPWDFPFSMSCRKVAPALAAGCTVVLNPSEFTPYCGLLWGVLADIAGFPRGVINVVTGDAAAIGTEFTSNRLVRKITFTGSMRVGKLLYAQSAATMKKISMELGGNAPFIAFDDADIDRAVEGAVAATYRNSGQTCLCANRLYVQDRLYDLFARRLAIRVSTMKVNNGFDPDAQQGPLINEAAVAKVEAHVQDAKAKGAHVLVGGRRHALGGNFYEPTVLVNANTDMLLAHEQTGGPVAALFRFVDEQQAIDAANSTESSLNAYFYTQDLARTFRVSRAMQTGMISINEGIMTTEVSPLGSVGNRVISRDGSAHGIEEYLNLKYLSLGGL